MGSRPYHSHKERKEVNRKQRKERWINKKNAMRKYPDCAYNGDFFCNHVYEEERGWCWVDFSFFHTKLKKYFAVAMTTLEYNAHNELQNKIDEELHLIHPYPDRSMIFGKIDPKTGTGTITFTEDHNATYNKREAYTKKRMLELSREAQMMRPTVDVKDYGKVAVGLWVSLDVPNIDEHVIRDFIKFYRSIGEPITAGRAFTGEEVAVVPAKLEERYAKLRSNCRTSSIV